MKFDIKEITIARNAKIELNFINGDDMLHNVVFAKLGVDIPNALGEAALALGLDAPKYKFMYRTLQMYYNIQELLVQNLLRKYFLRYQNVPVNTGW